MPQLLNENCPYDSNKMKLLGSINFQPRSPCPWHWIVFLGRRLVPDEDDLNVCQTQDEG